MCDCFNKTQKDFIANMRVAHPDFVFTSAYIKPRLVSRVGGEESGDPKFGANIQFHARKKSAITLTKTVNTISFNYCPICGEKYE